MPASTSKSNDPTRPTKLWDALQNTTTKETVIGFLSGADLIRDLVAGGYGADLLDFMRKEYSSNQITRILTTQGAGTELATRGLSALFVNFLYEKLDAPDRDKVLNLPGLKDFKRREAKKPDPQDAKIDQPANVSTSWGEFQELESPQQQMTLLSNTDFVKRMVVEGKGGEVLDFMVDEFSSPKVAAILTADKVAFVFAGMGLGKNLLDCINMLKDADKERVMGVPGLADELKSYATRYAVPPRGPSVGPK